MKQSEFINKVASNIDNHRLWHNEFFIKTLRKEKNAIKIFLLQIDFAAEKIAKTLIAKKSFPEFLINHLALEIPARHLLIEKIYNTLDWDPEENSISNVDVLPARIYAEKFIAFFENIPNPISQEILAYIVTDELCFYKEVFYLISEIEFHQSGKNVEFKFEKKLRSAQRDNLLIQSYKLAMQEERKTEAFQRFFTAQGRVINRKIDFHDQINSQILEFSKLNPS